MTEHEFAPPGAAPDIPPPPTHEAAPAEPCFRSLWKVVVIQAQNGLNDKIAQYCLLGFAQVTAAMSDGFRKNYAHLAALLLALPLILFAPLAGWLSDRFSKRSILFWCSAVQLAGMVAITIAFYLDSFWVATFFFFILASQATIFSPAKGGIIKELVGEKYLSYANSWTQATGLLALVVGPWLGGALFKWYAPEFPGEPWMAAFWPMLFLTLATMVPVFLSMRVRRTPEHSTEPLRWGMLWEHFLHLGDVLRFRNLRLTALGVSFFWFSATVLALLLVQVGGVIVKERGGDPSEVSELGGYMLVWVGLGIAAGSVIVGYVSTTRIELGLVPIGGLFMALGSVGAAMPFVPFGGVVFNGLMFIIGVASGVFLAPLNAYLQDLVEPAKRGRQLAAAALMDSLGMFFGILVQLVWGHFFPGAWGARVQLALLGLLCLIAAIYVVRFIPQNFLRFVTLSAIKIIYRVRVRHADRIPPTGGALLIANHVSYIDAFLISAAIDRKVRFIASDQFYKMRWIGPILKLFNVVPVSPKRAKDAIVSVSEAIEAGDVVCIFPEGQITRTGIMNELHKGYEIIARRSQCAVVPVYLDDVWGSLFSFERGAFFKKFPKRFAHQISVGFGEPVLHDKASTDWARQRFRELSSEMILERRELLPRLEVAVAKALTRHPWRTAIIGKERVSCALLLGHGIILARRWREEIASRRVAVRAEGLPCVVANLALRLAGIVPVNVSMSVPLDRLAAALQEHGVTALISDGPCPEFEDVQQLDVGRQLAQLDPFDLALEYAAAYLLPVSVQMWRVGRHRNYEGTSIDAAAWLAERADGSLEYCSMTHRAILLQSEQLSNTDSCRDGEALLSKLSTASGPGTVLGLWHPLLHGITLIHRPEDAARAHVGIADSKSFAPDISGLARSKHARGLLFITTEMRNPELLVADWKRRAGLQPLPCLADARSGRLLTMSMPDAPLPTRTADPQAGNKPGSLGKLMNGYRGLAVDGGLRIVSPDGMEFLIPGGRLDLDDFLFVDAAS